MSRRRVVITGLGMCVPVGNSVPEGWNNIKNGISGIDYIQNWDASALGVRFAGEVKNFDPEARFGRREARRSDRITQLAWAATQEALADSGLEITDENRHDIGVLIGTGLGGLITILEAEQNFQQRGQKGVSPLMLPMMLPDTPSSKMTLEYGLRGPNLSVSSACSTGNNAIGEAAGWIMRGMAEAVVTGSTEGGVVNLSVASLNNMTALSERNDDPKAASRPFDRDRDGFVMAEGSAILILEELEFAKRRGARIYGEFLGYGMTSDAYHPTAPREDGDGARRAMLRALKDAQLNPEDISYVNAHGTSTPYNDRMETLALKGVFGEQAYHIPISSTKSMTGHLMSASASLEAIFSLKAIEENVIPPTLNLDNPDPECDLDYVPKIARDHQTDVVMSNSFGFGGHNVVIILGRYNGN